MDLESRTFRMPSSDAVVLPSVDDKREARLVWPQRVLQGKIGSHAGVGRGGKWRVASAAWEAGMKTAR